MRILLVTPYDITLPGGVTSHVLDLAHQFQDMGHPTMVVGPAGGGTLPPDGFIHHIGHTFRLPSPGDAARVNINPLIVRDVRAFLARREFDVIHLHEPFLPFLGPSFLNLANGIKIGTFHTWRKGPHVPYAVSRPLLLFWNRRLHGRIAVSRAAEGTIRRYVPGEYTIIPNGIDYERFATPSHCPPHLDDDRPTILFVGRLEARKGIPYLLRAFKQVKAAIPAARLVIVGTGGLHKKFEAIAARLQVEDVLFEGYVAPEALPGYYQRADVACAPSTVNESFGITLVEAMSAGAPLVATSIDGFLTVVEDGVNAMIVPPKNPGALAETVQKVLEDRALRERLSSAARVRAQSFSWPRVAQQLLDYYLQAGAENGVLIRAARSDPSPA